MSPTQSQCVTAQPFSITKSRYFEILCPIDVEIGLTKNEKTNEPALYNAAGDKSSIRSNQLAQMVTLMSRKEWRHPERPVLQFSNSISIHRG